MTFSWDLRSPIKPLSVIPYPNKTFAIPFHFQRLPASCGGLLRVDIPGETVVEYVNDPFGRRIAKKVNGNIVEKYLWQGQTRLLALCDGWDNLLCRFVYADARTPVAMEQGGQVFYLSYDQVGSLRQVTDSSGKAVKVLEYDAFGNIIKDSAPDFFLPIGFAGGLLDRHTGLVRFGFRDYDCQIGRWTAKDPIGFAAGDVDLFGYVGNDPVNGVDATGLFVGLLFGKGMRALRLTSATAQESVIAGQFADSAIGGLLGITGTDTIPKTGNTMVDSAVDAGAFGLQVWGTIQAAALARAAASAPWAIAGFAAAGAGTATGLLINNIITKSLGKTLGEYIYDKTH
ncbi:MAG: RHS repeat-associated core domain-containing protein [Desulfatibacillaceae bacterium]|nr:RHS repeat-associated core domain-containing protein [Desulfatibacillaceae bacterium]